MGTKSSKGYSVHVKLNGKTFNIESDSLKDAFVSMVAGIKAVKTKIFINIEGKEGTCNRVVMPAKGRQMLRNEKYIDIFIKHLIFKPYVHR